MSEPFGEIYETYKKAIYTYLLRNTYDSHIAEELTHDTFMKAFKQIHTFRHESSLKTWLFTIARNTYLSYQNKSSTKFEYSEEKHEQWEGEKSEFEAMVERDGIMFVLSALNEKERTYILLRDQQGMTYQEMSEVLGEKVGSVKVGLFRARKKFKDCYTKEYGGIRN